jgi:RNA polymerase sigma factor (sigma-70 family)
VPDARLVFAAHREGILRYLTRIVGPGEAPDLAQEVFLRVSRSGIPDADAERQRAWVFRIARNLALNHRRDTNRRPRAVALEDRPGAAAQEVAAALREALDQLPAVDREVFLLREAAGLSYDEIAAACDLTSAAVRSRLHRARQQLRACLAPPAPNCTPVILSPRSHEQS